MHYGDEYIVDATPGSGPDGLSRAELSELFRKGRRVTAFESTPDHHFIQDRTGTVVDGLLCYRINADSMIEINDAFMTSNEVSDLISFQFVSAVKRSEFLGKRKNVHDLGPALLVSAVPRREITYRVPRPGVQIQHVVVHTTLSTLLERCAESTGDYPAWLTEILDGKHRKPRQRVFFLEDVHRYSIWSCFHRPVSGELLGRWMSAKFDELLCIGLQILKSSRDRRGAEPVDLDQPCSEKIRRARGILEKEYANPPKLAALARRLGISETRLKSGFKLMHGSTVMQYCNEKRIEAARFLLRENRHSISEIGSIVGYEDPSAFARAFRRHCGTSPRDWQRSHIG